MARVVQAGLSLVAVPVILHFLGTEQYGLVGFAIALEAFQFFDLGLSGAVYREIARNSAGGRGGQGAEIIRAAEGAYVALGLVLAAGLAAAAPWLAQNWLRGPSIAASEVRIALILLALLFAIRWPVSLYAAALRGLQKHVVVNAVSVGGAILRVMSGILVIAFVSRTASALFAAYAAAATVQLFAMIHLARRFVGPAGQSSRSRLQVLRGMWRYALAVNGISMGIALLTQLPGLMVARTLPLPSLGMFAVAYSLAAIVSYVPNAVSDAAFPRLSAESAKEDREALDTTYFRSTRVTVAAAAGLGFSILFLGQDVLLLWTRSEAVSAGAAQVAGLLAVGNVIFAAWDIPSTLLLAEGRTKLLLSSVILGVPLLIVVLMIGLPRFGLPWAGAMWLTINVAIALVVVLATHHRLVKPAWKFLLRDVAPFVVVGALIFGVARLIVGDESSMPAVAALLFGGLLLHFAVSLLIVPRVDRRWVFSRIGGVVARARIL